VPRQAGSKITVSWTRADGGVAEYTGSRTLLAAGAVLIGLGLAGICSLLLLSPKIYYRGAEEFGHTLAERHTKHLTAEIERIQKYERELRERSRAIDSILKDAQPLEHTESTDSPVKKNMKWGIGGPLEPRAAIITFRGNVRTRSDSAWQKMKSEIRKLRLPSLEQEVSPERDLIGFMDYEGHELRFFPLGVPVDGSVSSDFGTRVSPFSGRVQHHDGIDLSIERSSGVVSTADGTVVRSGWERGYGYTVIVDHGNGLETLYGHLSKVVVKEGERVCRGKQVGLTGSSGNSTGPHVHYEIRRQGVAQDPSSFISALAYLKLIA
jgi:murein DD-endopeptidase MepM/ murein hydrolase activator NlpD